MKKWMYNVLIGIFAAVFLGSAAYLAFYFIDGARQDQRYDELSSIKEDITPRPTVGEDGEQPEQPTLVEVTNPKTGKTISILPEFVDLYAQNPDIIGWMTIPGTKIDYPVMQNTDDPDYYLYRNFDKKDSKRGCLYTWPGNDVFKPSDNITIYGHHMRDGSMFADLMDYKKKAFYEEHRYIYFDTLTELHTYEIIAVLRTTASVGKGFSYHAFIDAATEKEFDKFISTCKKLDLYDTGVTAQFGDKLICLSTCEYSQENGRLVVVAKRIV